MWYREGTVSVDGTAVKGSGTRWMSSRHSIGPGQMFIIPGLSRLSEIKRVVSDTELIIADSLPVTETGAEYAIATFYTDSVASFGQRLAIALGYYQQQLDAWQQILTGSGSVVIETPGGETVEVPSMSSLSDSGFALLSSATDSDSEKTAATSKAVKIVAEAAAAKIPEAPEDGKQYVRENGRWRIISLDNPQVSGYLSDTDYTDFNDLPSSVYLFRLSELTTPEGEKRWEHTPGFFFGITGLTEIRTETIVFSTDSAEQRMTNYFPWETRLELARYKTQGAWTDWSVVAIGPGPVPYNKRTDMALSSHRVNNLLLAASDIHHDENHSVTVTARADRFAAWFSEISPAYEHYEQFTGVFRSGSEFLTQVFTFLITQPLTEAVMTGGTLSASRPAAGGGTNTVSLVPQETEGRIEWVVTVDCADSLIYLYSSGLNSLYPDWQA